jgi:hypothetical protein
MRRLFTEQKCMFAVAGMTFTVKLQRRLVRVTANASRR